MYPLLVYIRLSIRRFQTVQHNISFMCTLMNYVNQKEPHCVSRERKQVHDYVQYTHSLKCLHMLHSTGATGDQYEQWADDMVDIHVPSHQHQYGPMRTETKAMEVWGAEVEKIQAESLHHLLIGGDQLTVERIRASTETQPTLQPMLQDVLFM